MSAKAVFQVGTIVVANILCLDLQLYGGFWILKIVSFEYRELQNVKLQIFYKLQIINVEFTFSLHAFLHLLQCESVRISACIRSHLSLNKDCI